MPKRSAQSQIERYARKIRKIEDNEKRRRRILSPLDSSSDDEGNEDPGRTLGNNNEAITGSTPAVAQTLGQDEELESAENAIPNEDLAGPSNQEETDGSAVPDLDPELLSALGESTSDTPDYGENIHDNLSRLWLPLLKKGMPKENKDKLLNEYVIPDNCRLLQAPNLNAEISAAVPDMVRNRDKTLKATQQQLGSGITAINRAIDLLLKSDNKVQAMKHLSNGCRLLCDSHYTATQNRIKLVAPSLDKSFLHMISESERDDSLFGSTLSEKIKAAKAIEKQGLSIKKPAKPQKPTAPPAGSRSSFNQGNWNAHPRYPANRGGRGGYRRTPMTSATRRPYTPSAQQPQREANQDKPRAPAQSH
ncbi:Reverse transcriptase and recombinase [Operophtera brumata]|uniref:Reverse transcriptase and recombinase n=1 Tax=Operophtera brumata TaxID=104452 RepID=A0A0L7LHF5_OPEBR|nr:Reverse transcriptase and recombinase [Operophtera brumata]